MIHRKFRRPVGILLVVGSLIAAPAVARADRVDHLIEQGVSLRVQGRPADALELFTMAHALAPTARTLAQMGLAEGALHHWLAAEDHLSTALASHDTPWIDIPPNREALERALETVRSHVGNLKPVGPAGALVTLDGREVGRLPLASALRVAEGSVHLEATAAGFAPTEADVVVIGGGDQTVLLRLAPLPSPVPAALNPRASLDEASPPERWKTWTGVSLLGASATGVAAGIVWLAVDGHASCPGTAACAQVYDTKVQGWVAIGAGLATGAAGALFLWSGQHSQTAVAAGTRSVALVGRF